MILSTKKIITAFVIIFLYAFAINEWNIHEIKKNNPTNKETNSCSLVSNSTIFSVDNEWYLPQIKNLLNGKGFTSNPDKPHYDVRRTPIYPSFYGLHYLIFGEKNSFYFIRFTQIFLFALATIALLFATFNFTSNKKISFATAILFGFNPVLISYLYFTITEAISPALVCFILYFLSKCYLKNKNKDWLIVGLFFAIGALCRPAIIFISIAILFAIIYINRKQLRNVITSGLFFIIGASILFVPYIIRNYKVTKGDFILLEKYYGDPMDFGIPNIELRSWISCWNNPADYSSEVVSSKMLLAITYDSSSTKEKLISTLMQELPTRATLVNKKEDIKLAYESLYDYYNAINKELKPNEIANFENISISKMQLLKNNFIEKAPLQYYVITPLLILKSVILQSNSSSLVMLDNYETSTLKKIGKALLYLLNIILFLSIFISIFYIRKYFTIIGFSLLFIITSFAYIILILRYIEARYLIPISPSLFILCSICIVEISEKISEKYYTSR